MPFFVLSDPPRLRRILVNLIGNAVKFTEKGTVDIGYGIDSPNVISLKELDTVSHSPADKQNVFVSIHDTGIGIPEDYIQMIFQPFSQADTSLTRRYGGTGIGLAVAKHTAEMLGGSIAVTSTVGQGSIFTLTFPAWITTKATELQNPRRRIETVREESEPAQDTTCKEKEEEDDTELNLTGYRVLVVDDVRINRIVLSTQLRAISADISFAENGQEAIDLINQADTSETPFDIVLMDMQMPVMDGYAAVRQLRSQGYKKPIIAVTAHALPGDHEKTLVAGCDGYLSKPIDSQKLLEMIRNLIQTMKMSSE
jgi:CheY-like chemotaxis protein